MGEDRALCLVDMSQFVWKYWVWSWKGTEELDKIIETNVLLVQSTLFKGFKSGNKTIGSVTLVAFWGFRCNVWSHTWTRISFKGGMEGRIMVHFREPTSSNQERRD